MTSPGPSQKSTIQSRPRQVRIVLRDGAIVDGGIFLNEGQALAPYLGSRKGGWVNLINATWIGANETHAHAVLQSDHILSAISADGDIPVYGSTAGAARRDVDITLEDASHICGTLHIAERQRLCDFLHACGKFLPLLNATRVSANEQVGDCAVNSLAIRVIRDAKLVESGSVELTPEIAFEARPSLEMQAIPSPANKDVVRIASGSIEVFTEGRNPDRRTGRSRTPLMGSQPLDGEEEPVAAELTEAQRGQAETLAHHWLVQLAAAARLAPPDPRELPESPGLEEIWTGLALRNGIPEAALAAQVGAAFKLPVAKLSELSPHAVASIPERLARKLGAIPLSTDAKNLVIAISDPSSLEVEQQLGFVTRKQLRFQVAAPSAIREALDSYYESSAPG